MEEILRALEAAPPLCSQDGRELIRAAKKAFDCWNAIPRLPVTKRAKDDIDYQPRTEFGRRLLEIRSHIVASGAPMLSWEEIDQEVASRRDRDDL